MKRKAILISVICVFAILLNSCQRPPETDKQDNKQEEAVAMKLLRYFDETLSVKLVPENTDMDSLITEIKALPYTEYTGEKISDDIIDTDVIINYEAENKFDIWHTTDIKLPIEDGTIWLEIGEDIYRVNSYLSKISRVEGHLGKGYVLGTSQEFREKLNSALSNNAVDSYYGTYNNETKEIEIKNTWDSKSTVDFRIKEISVTKDSDFCDSNKITLELISTIDQNITINWSSEESSDVILTLTDSQDVSLEKYFVKTVELIFGGRDNNIWLYINFANTKITLKITP